MREQAKLFSTQGYNCSQCILMAASQKYGFPVSKETLGSCSGINNGFGVGTFCSALVGGIMVFGILFSEETAKFLRLQLLLDFREKYQNFNCCCLSESPEQCQEIIGDVAELTEKIIVTQKEREKNEMC